MHKQSEDSQLLVLTQPLDYAIEPKETVVKPTLFRHVGLIVNLIYAILFVGIVGYYFDKFMRHSRP